jgi:hypothetical protein
VLAVLGAFETTLEVSITLYSLLPPSLSFLHADFTL